MNCYFCNKIIINLHNEKYHCYNCNCTVVSGDNESVRFVYLYYKTYYLYLDLYKKYYSLNSLINNRPGFRICQFDNIPNINPRNIESKINTILAFL
jgi:hypothetical protein